MVYPPYETLYDGRGSESFSQRLSGSAGGNGHPWRNMLRIISGFAVFSRGAAIVAGNKPPFSVVLNLTGLVACLGFLVHSLVDFNVHLPANLLLFFMMATLATSTIGNPRNCGNGVRTSQNTVGVKENTDFND